MLAYEIVRADFERAGLTFVLQVLRCMSDGRKRIYLRAGTDARMPFDDDMRMEDDPFVHGDMRTHNAIGPDFHIGRELRLGVDGCC